jgi:hypothetical protein
MASDNNSSIVIGVYDNYDDMKKGLNKFIDESKHLSNSQFFYDRKSLNAAADWTNDQMSINTQF